MAVTKYSLSIWHLLSKRQIDGEDLVNFCGLLRKHELYENMKSSIKMNFSSMCYVLAYFTLQKIHKRPFNLLHKSKAKLSRSAHITWVFSIFNIYHLPSKNSFVEGFIFEKKIEGKNNTMIASALNIQIEPDMVHNPESMLLLLNHILSYFCY